MKAERQASGLGRIFRLQCGTSHLLISGALKSANDILSPTTDCRNDFPQLPAVKMDRGPNDDVCKENDERRCDTVG